MRECKCEGCGKDMLFCDDCDGEPEASPREVCRDRLADKALLAAQEEVCLLKANAVQAKVRMNLLLKIAKDLFDNPSHSAGTFKAECPRCRAADAYREFITPRAGE